MARRYRSRRRPGNRAVAAMMTTALGVALALAFLWPMLGELGELAFLGMAARGLIIGAALTLVARRAAFSRARAAAAIAGVATALCIVGGHYLSFANERAERLGAAQELRDQRIGFGSDPVDIEQHYDKTLSTLTFAAYWQRFFGLEGPGTDGASAFMGPVFGIALASLELLVAILVAMYLPAGQASEPVCQECGRWSAEQEVFRSSFGRTMQVIDKLVGGECEKALAELEPADTKEYLQLSLAICPDQHDASEGVLRFYDHFVAKRGRQALVRHRADVQLTAEERANFDATIASMA